MVQKITLNTVKKKKSNISNYIQQEDSKDIGKSMEPSRTIESGAWSTSGMTLSFSLTISL